MQIATIEPFSCDNDISEGNRSQNVMTSFECLSFNFSYIAVYNCRTLVFNSFLYFIYVVTFKQFFMMYLGAQLVVVGVVPPPCVAR